MKKLELGQTVQIIANVGVILGLVILAFELRQNNELLGIEIRSNQAERIIGTSNIQLDNPNLIELLEKDPARLSTVERDTLIILGVRSLSSFESAYREVLAGFEEEEQLRRAIRAVWNRPHLNYAMPLAWETFRPRGTPAFVAWMEENVIGRATD